LVTLGVVLGGALVLTGCSSGAATAAGGTGFAHPKTGKKGGSGSSKTGKSGQTGK
jgi:hypothetical protein